MKKLKRGTLLGGLVLLAVLIASFFNGLLPGLGPGDPVQSSFVSVPSNDTSKANGSTQSSEGSSRDRQPENSDLSDDVLVVVVGETGYAVRRKTGENRVEDTQIDLDRLIELAKAVGGDNNGIRVRVLVRESSRELTQMRLKEKLAESGLKSSEIFVEEILIK